MKRIELEDEEHAILLRVLLLINLAFVQEVMEEDDEEAIHYRSGLRKFENAQ